MRCVQSCVDMRRLDLGPVTALDAQSFGEPGHRTFRLLARTPDGQVSVWLEKEQIVMLGAAIDEVLGRRGVSPATVPPPASSSFTGELEVKAGSLALGYDAAAEMLVFEAGEFLSAFDLEEIVFAATKQQAERVKGQIDVIARGGRPRCPLCGTPLTGDSHFCPPSNGHARRDG